MEINKNIKVEAVDDRNICILKRTTIKGKEDWKRTGYYTTPQGALKGLVNDEIIGTGLKDFETVCNKINELYKLIDGLTVKSETPKKNDEDINDFLGE
ncbi:MULTISPECIES: hypothetical protein [Clostridium]|uniref:hypothetical protein n=1 Tax=Clostridium TaxID=1485 RepID=UPI00069D01B6|nr:MULTISPECIES: hypothetical protein [Clostridium]KOF56633.1 hypothetical protein AGR56_07840 [Clostridium sp. DMHC 10]MCD2348124.1 hypothetical protein [Clostridium guangxiense]